MNHRYLRTAARALLDFASRGARDEWTTLERRLPSAGAATRNHRALDIRAERDAITDRSVPRHPCNLSSGGASLGGQRRPRSGQRARQTFCYRSDLTRTGLPSTRGWRSGDPSDLRSTFGRVNPSPSALRALRDLEMETSGHCSSCRRVFTVQWATSRGLLEAHRAKEGEDHHVLGEREQETPTNPKQSSPPQGRSS